MIFHTLTCQHLEPFHVEKDYILCFMQVLRFLLQTYPEPSVLLWSLLHVPGIFFLNLSPCFCITRAKNLLSVSYSSVGNYLFSLPCIVAIFQPLSLWRLECQKKILFTRFFLWGTEQKWTCIPQVVVSCKGMFPLFLPFPCHFLLTLTWRKMVPSHMCLNVYNYSSTLIPSCSWEEHAQEEFKPVEMTFYSPNWAHIRVFSRAWRRQHPAIPQRWLGSHQPQVTGPKNKSPVSAWMAAGPRAPSPEAAAILVLQQTINTHQGFLIAGVRASIEIITFIKIVYLRKGAED